MSYDITPNTFKAESTEVRKEVVQRLIDYFMRTKCTGNNEFVPNECWIQNYGLRKESIGNKENWKETLWDAHPISGLGIYHKDEVRVRTSEMVEFCKIWRENGYFISRGIQPAPRRGCSAIIYKFTAAPFTQYGFKLVDGFIDTMP